VEYTLTPCPIF